MARKTTCSRCDAPAAGKSAYCSACYHAYTVAYDSSTAGKAVNAAWITARRHRDESYRLALNYRIELGQMLRTRGKSTKRRQPNRIEVILGCSREEFFRHIERQFRAGMTWENRGRYGWHLHFRKPFKGIDCTDLTQLMAVGNYSNISPEWPKRLAPKRKGPAAGEATEPRSAI